MKVKDSKHKTQMNKTDTSSIKEDETMDPQKENNCKMFGHCRMIHTTLCFRALIQSGIGISKSIGDVTILKSLNSGSNLIRK